MSDSEALTATLEVPGQHVELFCLAALHELGENATWVKQQQQEASKAADPSDVTAYLVDRVGGPMRYLESSADVVRELFGGETTITSRVTNLAHIAEAMGRDIVKPRIAKTLGVSPIEAEDAEEVEKLAEALVWSTRTAAGLHGRYAEECDKRRSEEAN